MKPLFVSYFYNGEPGLCVLSEMPPIKSHNDVTMLAKVIQAKESLIHMPSILTFRRLESGGGE